MGSGMPMAVAAALRRPGTQVVAFVGDGGTLMTGNEIATAFQYGANPIIIISDNGMYGTIGMHSYVRYPERPFMGGTRLTNPDFAAWGRSFGAEGITIRTEAEVADGIARAFAVKTRPVVVHYAHPSNPVEPRGERNAGSILEVSRLARRAHDARPIVSKSGLGLKSRVIGRK